MFTIKSVSWFLTASPVSVHIKLLSIYSWLPYISMPLLLRCSARNAQMFGNLGISILHFGKSKTIELRNWPSKIAGTKIQTLCHEHVLKLLSTQADVSLTSLNLLLAHFCTVCCRQVAGIDNSEANIISSITPVCECTKQQLAF